MAARVIHFGRDDCHRVQVLRSVGYEVREATSLADLCLDLQRDEQVDAVILSEEDQKISEQAAAVVRRHGPAPVILFRALPDCLSEHLFDRVFTSVPLPEQWLSQTAELIAESRAARDQSQRLHCESEQLRSESRTAVEKSRWQRARSRALKHHRSLGEPWELESFPTGVDEDIDHKKP